MPDWSVNPPQLQSFEKEGSMWKCQVLYTDNSNPQQTLSYVHKVRSMSDLRRESYSYINDFLNNEEDFSTGVFTPTPPTAVDTGLQNIRNKYNQIRVLENMREASKALLTDNIPNVTPAVTFQAALDVIEGEMWQDITSSAILRTALEGLGRL